MQEAKRGAGAAAVFIARNRFAVLDRAGNQILVKNLRNEVTCQTPCPLPVTDNIFYAGTGLLLCRSDEKVLVRAACLLAPFAVACHHLRLSCVLPVAEASICL